MVPDEGLIGPAPSQAEMDQDFRPPEHLSLSGNPAENWRRWRQRFELFVTAKEADQKPDATKIAMLLSAVGPEALERYNHFGWQKDEDKKVYKNVVEKFESEFAGVKRQVFSRFQFWDHQRGEGQPFDDFLLQLRSLALSCEFLESDNMLRDKIIFSTTDRPLKERLLREGDVTLPRAIELCRAAEVTQKEMQRMKSSSSSAEVTKEVHAVKRKPTASRSRTKNDSTEGGDDKSSCDRCGYTHGRRCPAMGKQCMKCSGYNHFARKCRSAGAKSNVHDLQESPGQSEDEFFIDALTIGNIDREKDDAAWYSIVQINGSQVKVKLDTGAAVNVLPRRTFAKLRNTPALEPVQTSLKAYGGHTVEHMGRVSLQCQSGSCVEPLDFYIVDAKVPPIFGLRACRSFGFVGGAAPSVHSVMQEVEETAHETFQHHSPTEQELVDEFSDVFNGLGKFSEPYNISLKPEAVPVIDPPRWVPLSLRSKLQDKLTQMEADGIIAKVDGPTDWVSSMVITEKKDGSLRICLDPQQLNEAIKREHFQIPTFEDVVCQLGGKKYFTVLDQKDSFWQIELSEQSSFLCTFNTPFARYRFQRMPFGICSASEVQQKRTYKAFGDIPGVHIIADDMIVAAESAEEHDGILRRVLQRAREQNVKFNSKKMQYKTTSVTYMGNIITKDGVKPDPAKVKAIVDMPTPKDKSDVQRLLGMVSYLSSFIPNMSTITSPLRSLLKKSVEFQWLPEHQAALAKLKEVLSAKPVLGLFDPKKKVTLQTDASSKGLGACLLQGGQPIVYGSRALTESEQRWFQIEKELLAVVFGAERFHQYIFGRDVEVHCDHKPLETILRKPIQRASPRVQLMMLRLLRYNLDVKYVQGAKLYIADTLSRAYIPDQPTSAEQELLNDTMELRIHSLIAHLPISDQRMAAIREGTVTDAELQKLKRTIQQGWPKYRRDVHPSIRQYWQLQDELHVIDGMIFRGECIVIPRSLRGDLLERIHQSHLGMDKCKARARMSLYWPGMSRDIEEQCAKCTTCAKYQKSNQKEPLMAHEIPDQPWLKIGADIFTFGGIDYLLMVDYFSKYPEVCRLEAKTAESVVSHFKATFARHGIPEVLVADNMPFGSRELRAFAHEWGFCVTTSSPKHAASNGQSERFVGTVKQLMRKAFEEGRDPHIALLMYRNTPISGMRYSPAQLLMSRMLRDHVPTPTMMLHPKLAADAHTALMDRQAKQKKFFDRGAKTLPAVEVGDTVRVQFDREWCPGIITGKHPAPRSFYVTTNSGRTYRRNRRAMRKSREKPPVIVPDMQVEVQKGPVQEPGVPASSQRQEPTPTTTTPAKLTSASPQRNPRRSLPALAQGNVPVAAPPVGPVEVLPGSADSNSPPARSSTRVRMKPRWMEDYVR